MAEEIIHEQKDCTKCGPKPRSEFGVLRSTRDGLNRQCRTCTRATQRAYEQSDRGRAIQRKCYQNFVKDDAKRERLNQKGRELRQTPQYRTWKRDWQKRYNQTPQAKERRQRYLASEKGRENARRQREKAKQRGHARKYVLKRYNGLTVAEYDGMYESQKGKCLICGIKPSRNLDVDHDHQTGIVRGLLCTKCNRGLGHFNDSPALLEQAKQYVVKHSQMRLVI